MKRILIAIAIALLGHVAGAQAQTFPSRTITMIVPFPPGGETNGWHGSWPKIQVLLGQPVIIENVGGAVQHGGGASARAVPDGYTIDIGQWDTHVGSIIYKLNYDLKKDFAPIGLISINPQLLIGKKRCRLMIVKTLVIWMKATPARPCTSIKTLPRA